MPRTKGSKNKFGYNRKKGDNTKNRILMQFSASPELYDWVIEKSSELGVSKSSFINSLLVEAYEKTTGNTVENKKFFSAASNNRGTYVRKPKNQ